MPNLNSTFRAQLWADQELIADIASVSIDAAREIARTAPLTGHTGRVMSLTEDYCEVYAIDGVRIGTFGETTRIRGAA